MQTSYNFRYQVQFQVTVGSDEVTATLYDWESPFFWQPNYGVITPNPDGTPLFDQFGGADGIAALNASADAVATLVGEFETINVLAGAPAPEFWYWVQQTGAKPVITALTQTYP